MTRPTVNSPWDSESTKGAARHGIRSSTLAIPAMKPSQVIVIRLEVSRSSVTVTRWRHGDAAGGRPWPGPGHESRLLNQ